MLTPEQVTTVSKSLIGHMSTDPAVRSAVDIDPTSEGANEQFATIFNTATKFVPAVEADDVPAILAEIKNIVADLPAFELNPTHLIGVLVKSP